MTDPFTYGFMVFWYIIIIASVVCYAMLDGFDLGVGALHLFTKDDQERRIFLNAIGPVWDGNEVWLVVLMGGLFAGFPLAYATLLSAFYTPLSFLIFALIFRAVAIEFRSKIHKLWWRKFWDILFFLASVAIALAVGMALGNLIQGIPLDSTHNYTGHLLATFFRPYSILVGILTLSLFIMHGTIYLVMKTEGNLQERIMQWIRPSMIFFIMTYAVTTVITLIYQQHMVQHIRNRPFLLIIALANMFTIAAIPRDVHKKRYGTAFIASCLNIALLLILFAIGTFPDVIRSSIEPATNSISIETASASIKTLIVLTVIVGIGLPFVFAYGFFVYRIFRGKVKLDKMSY
jgi:cytochrome d ubiquinol oxidase subunit II